MASRKRNPVIFFSAHNCLARFLSLSLSLISFSFFSFLLRGKEKKKCFFSSSNQFEQIRWGGVGVGLHTLNPIRPWSRPVSLFLPRRKDIRRVDLKRLRYLIRRRKHCIKKKKIFFKICISDLSFSQKKFPSPFLISLPPSPTHLCGSPPPPKKKIRKKGRGKGKVYCDLHK